MDESTFNGTCTGPERWVGCEYRRVTIFSNAAVISVALAMNGRLRFVGLEEGAVSVSSCADSGAGCLLEYSRRHLARHEYPQLLM